MSDQYKRYYEQYISDEPRLTPEEEKAKELEKRLKQCREQFHVDMDFDTAVAKLDEFDKYEPFLPCEIHQYGEVRVCFRVFEKFFMRGSYASLSVYMEESRRFGVDITAIASGAGEGIMNRKEGVSEDYINQLKRHMGLKVPKIGLKERAKRYFLE